MLKSVIIRVCYDIQKKHLLFGNTCVALRTWHAILNQLVKKIKQMGMSNENNFFLHAINDLYIYKV